MGGVALVWLTTTWLPVAVLAALRLRGHVRVEWQRLGVAVLLGVVAGALGSLAELRVFHMLALRGVDPRSSLSLVVALAFAGPLAEGATLAAAWPGSRRALADGPFASGRAAAAAATGYLLADHFIRLWRGAPLTWMGHLLTTLTFVMLASSWGYMAGRAGSGAPGRKLFPTWVAAALLRGLVTYVLSFGAALATLVVAPLTLLMLALALVVREDARSSGVRESIYEARDALVKRDRPISIAYVLLGMLANQGALIVTLGLSLYAGTRMGVPFSLIDDLGARATMPLAILGVAGLLAFPLAGFFVARGRREPTLVEPALSAGLAIVVTLLSLGVTSPIAFVFVLATAPVALVLACGGAWVGMGRR